MRILKIFFAFFILAASISFPSFSEDALTLSASRSLALARSKTLASSSLSVESAILDEKAQFCKMLPSITLSSSASVALPANPGRSIGDTLAAGASLSVKETVWDGKNSVLKAIDALATASARESARAEYFSVLDSVDSAYYGFLESKAALAASRTALESAEKSLAIAEVRYSTGAISRTDYLEAEAESSARQTSLSQSRRDRAIAAMKLASLTGLASVDGAEDIDFARYDETIRRLTLFTDADTDNLIASVRTAVTKGNPALAKGALANAAAAKNVDLAAAAYFPTFSASYSAGLDYSVSGGTDVAGSLSLSGSLPLDVWNTKISVDGKKIAQKQASLALDESGRTIDIALQSAVLNCIAQARSVMSSAKSLEYAQKHYEDKFEMYKLSAASISDLSTASTLLGTSENEYISARYGFLSCLSAIRSLAAIESDSAVLELIK